LKGFERKVPHYPLLGLFMLAGLADVSIFEGLVMVSVMNFVHVE
jgi:hypothetical protein